MINIYYTKVKVRRAKYKILILTFKSDNRVNASN